MTFCGVVSAEYNHVPFGWRQHLITWKPTGFYSRVSTRDCLKFCELNMKWLLLPSGWRALPSKSMGWEGSLTNEKGMIPFDMTIKVRGHASLQQEPPLSLQTIERGGWVLLESAVFHGGFWVKKCSQRYFFCETLRNLVVGKVQHTSSHLRFT